MCIFCITEWLYHIFVAPVPCPGGEYCQFSGLDTPTGLCSAGYFCVSNSQTGTPDGSDATGEILCWRKSAALIVHVVFNQTVWIEINGALYRISVNAFIMGFSAPSINDALSDWSSHGVRKSFLQSEVEFAIWLMTKMLIK